MIFMLIKQSTERGRPSKMDKWLTTENLNLIKSWAQHGLTQMEIAENMKITPACLTQWIRKSPLIKDAIGFKERAFANVENALYMECIGYHYREQVVTNKGEVLWLEKFKAPSVSAQIFFLKNRVPEYWADRREVKYKEDAPKKIVVKWGGGIEPRALSLPPTQRADQDA